MQFKIVNIFEFVPRLTKYLNKMYLVCSDLCLMSFGEGNGNPLQYSCLENPMDGGAW